MLCRHVYSHMTHSDVPMHSSLATIKQHLLAYMKSQSATQRIVGLAVLSSWWEGIQVRIAISLQTKRAITRYTCFYELVLTAIDPLVPKLN